MMLGCLSGYQDSEDGRQRGNAHLPDYIMQREVDFQG
jgi:hypothetical protein